MRQRVHLITLGVDDLDRSRAFYEALGWTPVPDTPPGLVAFDLYGSTIGLYPRADLSRDMGQDLPKGSGSLTLSANTRDRDEVDRVLAEAAAAGATILKPGHEVFWGGYIGYFSDPDGHIWEVAFNPHSPLGPDDQFQWAGA